MPDDNRQLTTPANPAPAQSLSGHLFQALADPNITAEKMQIVLQMQRELIAEQRRESFQEAYARMAKVLPQVTKDGVVELVRGDKVLGSYRYAKWEDMDTVLRPILSDFGFALSFYTRAGEGGRTILGGRLLHVDGHFEVSERYLQLDRGPGRNDLQAEGSGQSYAKRYTAEALLNIVRKGEDDDGVSAMTKTVSDAQIAELDKLLTATKTNCEKFLAMFVTGVTQIDRIPARDFPRLKNALAEKQAAQAKAKPK